MMAEILEEEARANRLAEFQAQLEAEKAAAAASTAAYQAKVAAAEAAAAAAAQAAAATAAAQAAAVATAAPQISLSGSASVSYDDNGTSASATTYDADLIFAGSVGTVGGTNTTVTVGMDVNGANAAITGADMATTIGPVTIAADMHDEVSKATSDGDGDYRTAQNDTGVTISLDIPVGDATIGVSNSGNVVISGTFAGVTVTHTDKVGSDKTVIGASIAGMDVDITNDAGSTTWSLGTTVSGVDLTLNSGNDVTAAFGLAGNTLTVSHYGADAAVAATASDTNDSNLYASTAVYAKEARAAYTTVAVSRDLTSGATLSTTFSSADDSITLKAAVTF